MATATKTPRNGASRPVRRSSGGGGFWLLVLIVVLSLGAVFLFAPDLPRSLLGMAKAPDRKQEAEPTAAEQIATDTQKKEHTTTAEVDANAQHLASAPKEPEKVVAAPVVVKTTFADESKAAGYLVDAEKAYKAMQWTAASNAAHKIEGLDVTPKTMVRAKDIVNGATALDKLFKDLGDDKDELIRSYDTHPSLAEIETNGTMSLAVPIISMDNPTPIDGNPADAVAAQRASGKVNLLIKGRKDFMPASIPSDVVTKVTPVDLVAVMKTKRSELDSRVNKLNNGSEGANALAWYYAGRFAYRNRIDERVTELLDKAVILDPGLVKSVREDKAATLYANVICHMKNGNQKQADAFMAIIARKFADTDQGKQAKLFYEGKTAELLTLAKQADEHKKEQAEESRKQRLERANQLGDKEAIAKIKSAPTPEPEDQPEIAASSTSSGDADKFYKDGLDIYSHAQQLGATTERNSLYHQAAALFLKAKAIYVKLVEKNPNDEALAAKMIQNQQLWFGAHKYATE
jgi:hypothetical protein